MSATACNSSRLTLREILRMKQRLDAVYDPPGDLTVYVTYPFKETYMTQKYDPKAHRLAFHNPAFQAGDGVVQTTFRRGPEWGTKSGSLVLLNGLGKPVGTGEIVAVITCPIAYVGAEWLALNHAGPIHTKTGLIGSLVTAYCDNTIDDKTIVSVIFFTKD